MTDQPETYKPLITATEVAGGVLVYLYRSCEFSYSDDRETWETPPMWQMGIADGDGHVSWLDKGTVPGRTRWYQAKASDAGAIVDVTPGTYTLAEAERKTRMYMANHPDDIAIVMAEYDRLRAENVELRQMLIDERNIRATPRNSW